jgi:small-conductance mechanosensitive channel
MISEFFVNLSTINVLGTEVPVTSLIIGVVIMIVGVIVAKIASIFFKKYFAANLEGDVAKNLNKAIYYGIIIISLLAVTTSQGIDLSGLMVAGGIFLMFDRPAKTGDLIEIPANKIYGRLMDITIFSTRIKLFDGSIMRVPNQTVFTSEIRNVSGTEVRRIEGVVGIAYKENIDHAISEIKKSVATLPYVLAEPEPAVWVEQLADSGVNLRVLIWFPRDDWDYVGPVLMKKVKEALDGAGIEIPFPQRTVWLQK